MGLWESYSTSNSYGIGVLKMVASAGRFPNQFHTEHPHRRSFRNSTERARVQKITRAAWRSERGRTDT
eukprot:COSAG02_NODE_5810_length_4021_cov_33.303927_2_plen_68_part_00